MGPRSASTGGEFGTASTAARTRSCSLLNLGRSRSLTARCTRTTSAVRGDVAARRSSPVGPTSDRVRCARTSERSVAGWEATPPKCPGSSASTARTAPASTGVERGRRPEAATAAAPRSSASRYGVRKVTAAIPPAWPSARRAAMPIGLDETTTDTGRSGSPPFSRAISAASARWASAPYGVVSTWIIVL